jgi:hypothetical protein
MKKLIDITGEKVTKNLENDCSEKIYPVLEEAEK